MNKKALSVGCFLCLFITSGALAQPTSEFKYDPEEVVRNALIAALRTKYSRTYEVSYHIMDSLIAHAIRGDISDPYGTLAGCVLFSAMSDWDVKDSTITGMFKNGEIVWDDYPGTNAGFGGELITTKDINKDGVVDILEAEMDEERTTREGSGISYLWILSWDGRTGRIINDIDSTTHQSILVSTDMFYRLVDMDHDGIMEIRAVIRDWREDFPRLNPSTLPRITYTWNGSKYGFFPSAHQIGENEFYPANLMGVSVHSKVNKNLDQYIYRYTVSNQDSSEQSINHIYIEGRADTSSILAPQNWRAGSSTYVGGRFFFNSTSGIANAISPGHSLDSLGTISTSLPAVVRFHVQGYRLYDQTASDSAYRNDILQNSVSGYTVGTSDTNRSFLPLDIIDTLEGYLIQSRSIGWIANQQTADRYEPLLDSARARVQRFYSDGARTFLDTIVQNTIADSAAGTLTPEAYALIRFNSEYLRDHLPPSFSLLVNSSGSGSIQKSTSNPSYDSGAVVQLIAMPSTGYAFDHWSGDAGGTLDTVTITMDRNKTVTGYFRPNTFTITASSGNHGIISPTGVVTVNYGDSSTFVITPDTGYHVDSLIVDGLSQSPAGSYTFHFVVSNHTIRVTFSINRYSITATSGPGGSINPSGVVMADFGSTDTFAIVPALGYKISNLSVDGFAVAVTGTYVFTSIDANHTISATFSIDHYLTVPTRFASIQSAVDFSRYGDTIAVSPGSYTGSTTISGKSHLVILATGGVDQVTVKGFVIDLCDTLTLNGFAVDASGTGAAGIVVQAIDAPSSGVVLEDNEVKNSSTDGIQIRYLSTLTRIVNNRVHDNSANGISVGGGPIYMLNNTIVHNGYNGIRVDYNIHAYCINNIVSYNGTASGSVSGRYGVWQDPPPAGGTSSPSGGAATPNSINPPPCPTCITLINNLITGNNGTIVNTTPKSSKDIRNYTQVLDATDAGNWTTAGTEGTGVVGSTTVTFSDVFVAGTPPNLHLKSGSFAINRGVNSWNAPDPAFGAVPSLDFEGTSRPQGGTVDMGADEY